MGGWERLRISAALIAAAAAAAVLVSSNIGGWATGAIWFALPVITAGSLLAGLIVGSYVHAPIGAEATLCDTRWPLLGLAGLAAATTPGPDSLIAYLFSWAAPALLGAVIQPAIALASVALLGWALRVRLDLERTVLAPAADGTTPGTAVCPTCRPLFRPGFPPGSPEGGGKGGTGGVH